MGRKRKAQKAEEAYSEDVPPLPEESAEPHRSKKASRKRKKNRGPSHFDGEIEWQQTDVKEDAIFAFEHGGFMKLEEITDYEIDYENGQAVGIRPSNNLISTQDEPEAKTESTKTTEPSDYAAESVHAESAAEPNTLAVNGTKKKKKNKKKNKKGSAAKTEPAEDSKKPSNTETKEKVEGGSKPAVDMSAWASYNLPDAILRALGDMKYAQPTTIQKLTLEAYSDRQCDIVGAAETGSGKTLSFAIPMLTGILKISTTRQKKLLGLVMTPTRELALQVHEHFKAIAKHTPFKIIPIVGGLAKPKQERLLGSQPEIVVATPGRLWDIVSQGHEHFSDFRSLKFLVIDEADRMVEKGHFQELDFILSKLPVAATGDEQMPDALSSSSLSQKLMEKEKENVDTAEVESSGNALAAIRQTFIFSATLTLDRSNEHKSKKKKKKKHQSAIAQVMSKCGLREGYEVIDLTKANNQLAEGLQEYRLFCAKEEKDAYLYYLLKILKGRTLVFVNSVDCIRRLLTLLSNLELQPLGLHANLQQRQRLKNLDRFKQRPDSVLVATDVAARGLDIQGIEHVLHYEMPREPDTYVHRSGRTARMYAEGVSVALLSPSDTIAYRKIFHKLKRSEDLPLYPINLSYFPALKKRVNLASKIDRNERKVGKGRVTNNWFMQKAKEMDIELDDALLEDESSPQQTKMKQETKKLKAELKALLQQPIVQQKKAFVTTSASGRPSAATL